MEAEKEKYFIRHFTEKTKLNVVNIEKYVSVLKKKERKRTPMTKLSIEKEHYQKVIDFLSLENIKYKDFRTKGTVNNIGDSIK